MTQAVWRLILNGKTSGDEAVREAVMAMRQTVEDAVTGIRKAHMTRLGAYFVLNDLVAEVQAGRMTLKQAEEERERRFPLLRFWSGKIDYPEAFNLIMAK